MPLLLGLLGLAGFAGSPDARAAQSLNVFIWSEYIDPEVVKDFEKAHDARLTLDLYDDSESMLAKLQTARGQYDIVVPPDHTVPVLVKLGLLTPLRRDRLPNFRNLDPKFLGAPFDPKNEFTVPYQWGTTGLFYRKVPGKPAPDSWGAVFDAKAQIGPFVLIDSMRDGIGLALKYRGHSLNSVDPTELKEVREILVAAKRRSTAFEGSVGARNRVLSKSAVVGIVYSPDALRGIGDDAETGYVIPKEGSNLWFDNLAIPAAAPHRDLAETFINFLLDAKIGARISAYAQGATPNAAAREFVKPADLANPVLYPPEEVRSRLELMKDIGAGTRLYDQIWTQVKAR